MEERNKGLSFTREIMITAIVKVTQSLPSP